MYVLTCREKGAEGGGGERKAGGRRLPTAGLTVLLALLVWNALEFMPDLRTGLNTCQGKAAHPAVTEALGLPLSQNPFQPEPTP